MSQALLSMLGTAFGVGLVIAIGMLSAASIAGKPRRSTRTRKGIRHGR